MDKQLIFNFKTDLSRINIPEKLNNPFGFDIPEIAKIAAIEFQEIIEAESQNRDYKCRPILEYMLGDVGLFNQVELSIR